MSPTIFGGSDHDTDLGCKRGNRPARPPPRDSRSDIGNIDDLDEGQQVGTFAITFGITFAILYTTFERLNWPLFTYHPAVGKLDFWMQPARTGKARPCTGMAGLCSPATAA